MFFRRNNMSQGAIRKIVSRLLGSVLLSYAPSLYAQHTSTEHSENLTFPSFKERIAIKTNVVDWLLMTPNLAFDYDVVNTSYDKKSIGIAVKYNWNTSHTYIPEQVYNIFDVRLDYRFHWRRQTYDERRGIYNTDVSWEEEWLQSEKWIDRMKARIGCFRGSSKPNSHLSLFVGPYVSFSDFSLKLSGADKALGRQGIASGAGLTAGVAVPLYGYEDGTAIDLEFGGSVGWHFTSYDLYRSDLESNCYPYVGSKRTWVFYPLVTDMRVSLVYRFRSIRNQHLAINYELLDRRYLAYQMMQKKDEVAAYNESIKNRKKAIDLKNEEVAQYKATVESQSGFEPTLSLEYLQPYIYKIEPPKKYVRMNKDTLPKIHIDSIGQVKDEVLHKVVASIDSMPGISHTAVCEDFVQAYNGLADDQSKHILYRTEVIKEAYDRINKHKIEDINNKLVPGTFVTIPYSEKISKHNVYEQKRTWVDVSYTDSVTQVTMSSNEVIEWKNKIKKKAWEDLQRRRQGKYIRRVPQYVLPTDTTALVADSVPAVSDSISVDSISVVSDSLSVVSDSLFMTSADSISVIPDSIAILSGSTEPTLVKDSMAVDSVVTSGVPPAVLKTDSVTVDTVSVMQPMLSDTLALPDSTTSFDSIALPADTVVVGLKIQSEQLWQELYAFVQPVRSSLTNGWRTKDEE